MKANSLLFFRPLMPTASSPRCARTRLAKQPPIIGEVTADHPGYVLMKTRVGGTRVVDMLSGEQLPRIC